MIIRRRAIKQNNVNQNELETLVGESALQDNILPENTNNAQISAQDYIENPVDFEPENENTNVLNADISDVLLESEQPKMSVDGLNTSIETEKQVQPAIRQTMQPVQIPSAPRVLTPEEELKQKLDEVEKIDISSLEFKERFERRRGERRRGYRRIDERTLVSRAQEEAQSIRELAAKEGYKNGIAEATAELEGLKNSLVEFLSSKKEAYDALSDDMLELSLEIAKKIIKKEVELSGDVLKGVLSEVFDEISSNEEKITIKVAPDEVEFARASMPEILENSALDAKIVIIADEAVEKGSCVVITSNGVIDANFSTQLSIIQNAFGIYKGGA